jgi:transcriptional regulator with XRE-family HTH domain
MKEYSRARRVKKEINWILYLKVQKALSEKEMNSKDLSELTGIKKEWISMIIRGRKRSRQKEIKIAGALGLKWDYLFKEVS